jgi:hypothetical protein
MVLALTARGWYSRESVLAAGGGGGGWGIQQTGPTGEHCGTHQQDIVPGEISNQRPGEAPFVEMRLIDARLLIQLRLSLTAHLRHVLHRPHLFALASDHPPVPRVGALRQPIRQQPALVVELDVPREGLWGEEDESEWSVVVSGFALRHSW